MNNNSIIKNRQNLTNKVLNNIEKNNVNISSQQQNDVNKIVEGENPFTILNAPSIYVGTSLDIRGKLQTGIISGIEGIVDLLIGGVGLVGGLFDKNFENTLSDVVKYDWTKENFNTNYIDYLSGLKLFGGAENLKKSSLLKGNQPGEFVGSAVESIGQLLPSILVPNALGLAGKASQITSMGIFGASAAGGGTQEALQEGANLGQAYTYGLGSGAVEAGIELASGGIGGVGKGFIDKAASKIIKPSIIRLAIGEGLEEVASEFTTPALKMIYKDRYETPTLNEISNSFIVGALAGGIIQGGVKIGNLAVYGKEGAKAEGLINDIIDLNIKNQEENSSNILTAEKVDLYKDEKAKLAVELDKTFRSIDEKEKSKELKVDINKLSEEAKIKVEKRIIEKDTYNKEIERLDNELLKETNIENKNKIKREKEILENKAAAYIKSLPIAKRGQVIKNLGLEWKYNEKGILRKTDIDTTIYNTIAIPTRTKFNELVRKPIKNNIELSNEEIKNINISKKVIDKFNKENNKNLDLVVFEGRENENSFIDKNVVYINKNNTSNLKDILEGKESIETKEILGVVEEKEVKEISIQKELTKEELKEQPNTIDKDVELSRTNLTITATGKKMKTIYDIPSKPLTNKLEGLSIALVDAQAGIINYGVKNGVKKFAMEVLTNDARATSSRVSFALSEGITDKNNKIITKGIDKIFNWINELYNPSTKKNENAKYKRLASTRLAHNHNIDRQNVYPFVDNSFLKDIKDSISNKDDLELLQNGKSYYTKQDIDKLYKDKKIDKETYDIVNNKLEKDKETKSVFGTFLYFEDMNTETRKVIKEVFPNLYEAISNEKILSSDSILETIEEIVLNRDLTKQEKDAMELIYDLEKEISPNESRKAIEEIDKIDSRFKQTNEDAVEYSRGLALKQLENKLISQETYDKILYTYPNYIPTNRDVSSGFGTSGTRGNSLRSIVANTMKRAKGSDRLIEPLDLMLARKTMQIYRASDINNLLRTIFDIAKSSNVKTDDVIIEEDLIQRDIRDEIDYDTHLVEAPRANNTVTFYDGDKVYTMKVTENIYKGFYALNNHNIQFGKEILEILQKTNSIIKKLVTDYNPFFIFRNAARDLQDAGIYSKFSITKLVKSLPTVIKDMKTNSENWKLYRSVGGTYASMSDYEADMRRKATMSKTKNLWQKTLGRPLIKISTAIQKANFYVEQWIRFAEFKLALDNNYTPQEALYLANDVTVNFGRSGTLTKELNRTVALFLNAQVQGFSKAKRTFISKKTASEYSVLLSRVAVLAIVPAILNNLMYDDDDDYNALSQYYKDNFYLLKIGTEFIKIPKGRILSIFGSATTRTLQAQKGDEKAFEGYLDNAIGAISPIPSSGGFRFIWSPFDDVRTNSTWYGGEIESSKYDGIKPSARYTENTSWLGKKLGTILNYSPLKIDYLLDQYTGIIGDVLIPASSSSTETNALTFVKNNIVVDSTDKNKYASEFYSYYEAINYANNDGDIVSKNVLKYMNKVKSSISKLYQNEKQIIEDTNLSSEEKNKQLRLNQIVINNTMKIGLSNSKLLENVMRNNMSVDEYSIEDIYREATRLAFGSEKALNLYNKDVYDKSVVFNKLGFNFANYYNLYFDIKDYKDIQNYSAEDTSVQDSVSKKTQQYINKLPNTNKNIKLLLYLSLGNNISKEQLSQLKVYLKKYNLSKDELIAISNKLVN